MPGRTRRIASVGKRRRRDAAWGTRSLNREGLKPARPVLDAKLGLLLQTMGRTPKQNGRKLDGRICDEIPTSRFVVRPIINE